MRSCAARCAVLCVLALGLLSACGANDGQVSRRSPVGDGVGVTHAGVAVTHAGVAEPDPFRGRSGPDEVGVAEAVAVFDTVA